jgi:hypothetical protein
MLDHLNVGKANEIVEKLVKRAKLKKMKVYK